MMLSPDPFNPRVIGISPLGNNSVESVDTYTFVTQGGVDQYVGLFLPMDGVFGSKYFADIEINPKVVVANNGAIIDDTQSKFGGASGRFNSGTSYLTVADSDDFSFGAGDFTVEFFVRFNINLSLQQDFIGQQIGGVTNRWVMQKKSVNHNLSMIFQTNGNIVGQYTMTNPWAPSAGVWYHLMFVRSGSTGLIFVDGISQTLTANQAFGTNDVGNVNSPLYIGQGGGFATYFNGWMDYLRISKGIARQTANFTPPSAPYTDTTTITVDITAPVTDATPREVPLVYDPITGTHCAKLSKVNQDDRLVGLEVARLTMEDQAFLARAGYQQT